MFLPVLVALSQWVTTAGHATLTKPVTRNRGPLDVKGPADYQSGNGGGKGFNAGYQGGSGSSPCGDGLWGFSNNQGGGGVGWHYRGGDAKAASLHESWKLMLKDHNPALTEDVRQTYVQNQNIEVQVQITAYHGGFMTFHLCPVKDSELDFDVSECGLLEPAGSAAHSKHLLRNLTTATLPMPSKLCSNCAIDSTAAGFCGFNPGCLGDGPDGFAVFDILLEPSKVAMDHGVLVWHWFTANNGEGFIGGEEFMNCADVRISPSGSVPAPTVAPFSTTIAPHVTSTTPLPTAPVGTCKGSCSKNTQAWAKKCTWGDCVDCSECDEPLTAAPTPLPTAPVGTCKASCSKNTQAWAKKCTWGDCVDCSECDDLTPTPEPTSAITASPTLTPSSASGGCVDVQGNSCNACLAGNGVCYMQPKAWCDTFQWTWCGATLIQIRKSKGFLGLLQTATSLASRSSSIDAYVTDEL